MKKILILTNHLQNSDGVCHAAISLANYLATLNDVQVTFRPIFKFDKKMVPLIDKRVIIRPKYRFYLKGANKFLKLLPGKLLYKLMVKDNYDIEIGYCVIIPHIAIANSTNKNAVKFLWTHGYEYHKFYEKVKNIITLSQENKIRMEKDIGYKANVICCHNIIDSDYILKQATQNNDLEKSGLFTFISVARMSPEKGFDRLINASSKLIEEHYDFRVILVGDGPELSSLKNLVSKLKLNEKILFLGEKNNPHCYTKDADIYICTSLNEGFNTAMNEALILGVPAISTAVSGAFEMVNVSQAGFIMENSENGIYQGMKKVLDHKELLNDWKNNLEKTKIKFSKEYRQNEIKKSLGL